MKVLKVLFITNLYFQSNISLGNVQIYIFENNEFYIEENPKPLESQKHSKFSLRELVIFVLA